MVLSSENTLVSGDPFHHHQWEVSNQFSPLNNLGREGDPMFEEVEEVVTEVPSVSEKEGCDSQTSMTISKITHADRMQICESELLFFHGDKVGLTPKIQVMGRTTMILWSVLHCLVGFLG